MKNSEYFSNKCSRTEDPYENDFIKIHFIGHHMMSNKQEINYHYNPGYEICIILSGKGIFKIENRSYPICSNQIFITKASQYHGGWPSKDYPYRILFICFSIKAQSETINPLIYSLNKKLNSIKEPVANDNFETKDIHKRIIDEINKADEFSHIIIDDLIEELLIFTIRNFQNNDGSLKNNNDRDLSNEIIRYIDMNIIEEINLHNIGDYFKYSIPYLCRSFKNKTGFSIIEYYNYSRLELARIDLEKGNEMISTISKMYKFNSLHHFSNTFKEVYKLSPTEYRKKFKT